MVGTLRFAHPHMGICESRPLIGLGLVWQGARAAREARQSVARRPFSERGLASEVCCSSLHHLISGRIALVRTHIPHACGEEAMRMRPIYKTAVYLAHG